MGRWYTGAQVNTESGHARVYGNSTQENERMTTTQQIFNIIGGLGLFLLGMKVMSEGLQLAAGDRMRAILRTMTDNRIAGALTGVAITSLIQSSSATTLMLVSLVNAGLLTLTQSVGVIFGTNVGTTTTAWIVTLFGFKVKISSFALPAIGIGFMTRFVIKGRETHWAEVLMGFGLLFLGLHFLKEAVPAASASPAMHAWLVKHSASTVTGAVLALLTGTIVTAVLQSSSATTAVVLVMASSELVDFRTAMILFLGANIGTTATGLLGSVGTSLNARRAAVAHLLFNVIGAAGVLLLLGQFEKLIDALWPGSPYDDPESMLFHLAGFHTCFNLLNTLIFLPFVRPFAGLVCKLVPGTEEKPVHRHLRFIDTGLLATPALSVFSARQEIQRMIRLIAEMFDHTMGLFENGKQNGKAKIESVAAYVQEREQVVDMLEKEITDFLAHASRGSVSAKIAREIAGLITATSDLERVGDHCEALLKLLTRKHEAKLEFTENANREIAEIAAEVRAFLVLIQEHIYPRTDTNIMKRAGEIEAEINRMRWQMRDGHIRRLNEGTCEVAAGLIFLDMATRFEKIGDHAFNVAEVISGVR